MYGIKQRIICIVLFHEVITNILYIYIYIYIYNIYIIYYIYIYTYKY